MHINYKIFWRHYLRCHINNNYIFHTLIRTTVKKWRQIIFELDMEPTFVLINYLSVNNPSAKRKESLKPDTWNDENTTTKSRSDTKSHAQQMIFISGKCFAFPSVTAYNNSGKPEAMPFEYKNVRLCMEANKLLTNCWSAKLWKYQIQDLIDSDKSFIAAP